MRGAGGRRIALADLRQITDHRGGGTLALVIKGKVAVQPADCCIRIGNGLPDVKHHAGAAITVDHAAVDQLHGFGHAATGKAQGRRADQCLAIAHLVADGKLTRLKEGAAKGEIVRDCQVQAVVQGIARRQAGRTDVGVQADVLVQGDGLGHKAGFQPRAAEVDLRLALFLIEVARVYRHPMATAAWSAEGDGDIVTGLGIDHRLSGRVGLGHVKIHPGVDRAAHAGIDHSKFADEQAVAGNGVGNGGRVGQHSAIGQRDRRQLTAGARDNGCHLDVVG